jgi:glycosyltransferase involved in cell wall biosynthesis
MEPCGSASRSNDQTETLPRCRGPPGSGPSSKGVPDDLLRRMAEPKGDYLAFLGRISPEKRPDRAIARRAGLKLKIAAKIDAVDGAHFAEVIEPLLSERGVEFVGEIGDGEKPAFLGNAAALLFPIDWPEPFGLVMIEAMACGTPVVAWRCGAVPEVVDDGATGFIVTSEEEAVSAVERASSLDRDPPRLRAALHIQGHGAQLSHPLLEPRPRARSGAAGRGGRMKRDAGQERAGIVEQMASFCDAQARAGVQARHLLLDLSWKQFSPPSEKLIWQIMILSAFCRTNFGRFSLRPSAALI